MDPESKKDEPAMRVLEADEVGHFVAWLEGEAQPYFEPLGRAMVATAEFEAALKELLVFRLEGAEAWSVVHQLDVSQVLKALGSIAKHSRDESEQTWLSNLVRESNRLLEPRNLLAHGLWLPLYRRGMALVRHKGGRPGLQGKLVTVDEILDLATRASEIADAIRARVPHPKTAS